MIIYKVVLRLATAQPWLLRPLLLMKKFRVFLHAWVDHQVPSCYASIHSVLRSHDSQENVAQETENTNPCNLEHIPHALGQLVTYNIYCTKLGCMQLYIYMYLYVSIAIRVLFTATSIV